MFSRIFVLIYLAEECTVSNNRKKTYYSDKKINISFMNVWTVSHGGRPFFKI